MAHTRSIMQALTHLESGDPVICDDCQRENAVKVVDRIDEPGTEAICALCLDERTRSAPKLSQLLRF